MKPALPIRNYITTAVTTPHSTDQKNNKTYKSSPWLLYPPPEVTRSTPPVATAKKKCGIIFFREISQDTYKPFKITSGCQYISCLRYTPVQEVTIKNTSAPSSCNLFFRPSAEPSECRRRVGSPSILPEAQRWKGPPSRPGSCRETSTK